MKNVIKTAHGPDIDIETILKMYKLEGRELELFEELMDNIFGENRYNISNMISYEDEYLNIYKALSRICIYLLEDTFNNEFSIKLTLVMVQITRMMRNVIIKYSCVIGKKVYITNLLFEVAEIKHISQIYDKINTITIISNKGKYYYLILHNDIQRDIYNGILVKRIPKQIPETNDYHAVIYDKTLKKRAHYLLEIEGEELTLDNLYDIYKKYKDMM